MKDVHEVVRKHYAHSARTLPDHDDGSPPTLGLGDPVSLAKLRAGETVLDLGSGPGRDLLAAAAAVLPGGRAIGVDMTPEMVSHARAEAAARGLDNVSVLPGHLERLPLPDASVDVVISNCVINLVPDKRLALAEAHRVLVPSGRLAVIDTAFGTEPPPAVRADPEAWACCVGGALTEQAYADLLAGIGFEDIRLEVLNRSCGEACSTEVAVRSVAVTAHKPSTTAGRR